MNFKTKLLLIVSCLLLVFPLAVPAKKTSDIEHVDCANGDSIMKALESPTKILTIEISGICEEEVSIHRSDVTLRGTDNQLDGIRPVPDQPLSNALNLFGVHNVSIENLRLTGANVGLGMNNSFAVDVINCRIEDNDTVGVILGSASGSNDLIDTLVSNNGSVGVLIANGSDLRCWGCTVNNHARGFDLEEGASLGLFDATVQAARAVDAEAGSRVYTLFGSNGNTLEGSTAAIRLIGNASVQLSGDAIIGPLDLRQKSVVTLWDTTQTVVSGFNRIQSSSSLVVHGSTSLAGDYSLIDFSNLTLPGGTTVTGSVACGRGADAYCDDPGASVTGSSNCGQCPKP